MTSRMQHMIVHEHAEIDVTLLQWHELTPIKLRNCDRIFTLFDSVIIKFGLLTSEPECAFSSV